MSSNVASNSSEGKKVNCRYARENPTILTSVIREEDVESDDNYENQETSYSEDDDDDNVVYIDDDEIDAVASTVALISPSSAVCERLFARLVMGFGDD